MAGALCLALAVGAWYGLLWHFRQPEEGEPVSERTAPVQTADTQPVQRTEGVVLAPPAPSPAPPVSPPVAPSEPANTAMPKISNESAPAVSSDSAPKVSSDSAPKVLSGSVPKVSSDSAAKLSVDSAPSATTPTPPRARVSPFRQSHPWAAPAGGRYYYPSSCPATLELPDLVFFRTEAEARDSGYVRSRRPECE